ncbi:hypothetical protein ACIQTU_08605 [Brevundimonas sp. NPDC090276]|uniref:hypothetical protein n=1 Tax=Brevundimonas sp. NPDC090276 TaxID=3363956 RepID=UPI00383AAD12
MSKSSSSPQPNAVASAVAIVLNVEGESPPESVELIPAGVDVIGRDGRAWIEELEVREGGSIWGKPNWTPRAAN